MKIHMILQGKGGCGKSFISTILAQYITEKKELPLCIDTDPVNSTFSGFKKLKVKQLNLLEENQINTRNLDTLIEWIATTKNDIVIDNGAATFIPLAHYLIANEVPNLLISLGHNLIIHSVIAGGQSLIDTINGFSQLAQQMPSNIPFNLWLNEYFGKITYQNKTFEEMKAYKENKDRISSIFTLPYIPKETTGTDIQEMLTRKLTFDESLNDDSFSIMTRQRLKVYKTQIFNQLNLAVEDLL